MKKLVENVLIGADIELFLQEKNSGEIVSAEGFIKGTKHLPFNFDSANKYFSTSLDNVLGEFTIPPVTDRERFIEYIKKSVSYINSVIPETLCTVARPSASLDSKYLQTENAQTFGCDPDNCVWTKSINEKPSSDNKNLRSAGGHIHVGYDNPSIKVSEAIVKAMDLFLAVPSVLQEPDNERKQLYGKAGCFRFKDYGVEYRTISNYYVDNDGLMKWAFDSSMMAVDFVNSRKRIGKVLGEKIQRAINNVDKKMAESLVKEFNLQLV